MIAPIVGCGVAKDTSIQVAVKKALDDNKNISADKLIVNVKDGVVTISGELGTQKEIDLAVQVAMVVEGVVEVKNQMSLPDNYGSTDPIMNDFGLF
jgi:osmotically-inducible protein OsmY